MKSQILCYGISTEAPTFQVNVSVQGGTSELLYGSPVTLICDYTFDPADSIQSVAWLIGDIHGDLTPIASHIPPITPPIRYRSDSYKPPAYHMIVEEGEGTGQGKSQFMIQSLDWDDGRPFWCTVALNSALAGTDHVVLSVTGKEMQRNVLRRHGISYVVPDVV